MEIKREIYDEIINTLGKIKPEKGGILGSVDKKTITHYHYDENGVSTEHSYAPDVDSINCILEEWSDEGVYLVGFIHSHTGEYDFPSCLDFKYAEKILNGLDCIDFFYLPLLIFRQNGDKEVKVFKIEETKNDGIKVITDELEIIQ